MPGERRSRAWRRWTRIMAAALPAHVSQGAEDSGALLGTLAHLPALALEAAGALLLPLPAHLGVGLLPRVGLVAHAAAKAEHKVQGRLCEEEGHRK